MPRSSRARVAASSKKIERISLAGARKLYFFLLKHLEVLSEELNHLGAPGTAVSVNCSSPTLRGLVEANKRARRLLKKRFNEKIQGSCMC